MNRKKKKLYLSELFLEKLNGDFSNKAVIRAVENCNDEILKRMSTYPFARDLIDYFFYGKEQKQIKQELGDFRDVYHEFDKLIKPNIKKNYLILQVI